MTHSSRTVFAETDDIPIPPIWSVILLVIVTAFILAAGVGVRELDTIGRTTKNFLTGLLCMLWIFVVYTAVNTPTLCRVFAYP